MSERILVALAGNPNSGKSTIFNNITGARQHVGNYPGVTVEKREGVRRWRKHELHVVDLPGTYSLTAYSEEESVARNFIIEQKPHVVVDIIDSSNLERNLYLAVQLIEQGAPLILAFNMSDIAQARGIKFDLERLSHFLGAPIVPTVGSKNKGTQELLDAIVDYLEQGPPYERPQVRYGREIEEEIAKLQALIEAENLGIPGMESRWLALKLLENDREIGQKFSSPALEQQVRASTEHLASIFGESPEMVIADRRYGFISGACQETVRSTVEARHTMSDRIDEFIISPILGLPLFLVLMYITFHLTFSLGQAPMDWIDAFFGWLGRQISSWWPPAADSPLKSLLVDGIIGGVGGVVVFLPNILLLFMAIAIIEDTGYMARAAFIMDNLMHKIGLHGKSFIPMLIGFGCSIPAIMATRTLDTRRDRLTTMLVIPLMSCGARLPIYTLFIAAFFEKWRAPMLWLIYFIGIVLAVASAKLLRITVFSGESTPFVMELPPYRTPTVRGIIIHTWERGWLYLKKAGTIILAISIVMWALTTFPKKKKYDVDRSPAAAQMDNDALENARRAERLSYSIAGRIGHAIEPVIKPMGFDWRIGTALIGAFVAKEVFVAQMGIINAVGEETEQSQTLRDKLRETYHPLTAFCIMLFCLISAPCMATFAITRSESQSWKWALLQWGGLTCLGYILTTIVYQAGYTLGIGIS